MPFVSLTTWKSLVSFLINFEYVSSINNILDNLGTRAINKIDIDDVVFDVGKQKIVGSKRFTQDLSVFGNVTVGYLNGVNVTEAYKHSVLGGHNEVINGSIVSIINELKIKF